MTGVESTVHVRISHGSEEFGLLFSQLGRRDGVEGHLSCRRGIRLENAVFGPFLLILLLDDNQSVTLLGLVTV